MKETRETSSKPQAVTAQSSFNDPSSIAAYRDGLYVGKLVAERSEQRAAPVGRWATQRDRDAFQAGYDQAKPEIAQTVSED